MTIEKVSKLITEMNEYKKFNQLDFYTPFDYQREFHKAFGFDTTEIGLQRAIVAANKIGKTYCIAMEVAMHATGKYPEWWEGIRFNKPVEILVASESNELTRDVAQRELFGKPDDPESLGTGAIPKKLIKNTTRKPGVPNAYDSVTVEHLKGNSRIFFRAYEQKKGKFQGFHTDFIWLDEEPPGEILSQCVRSTFNTRGYIALSFTPENGMTEVTYSFLNKERKGIVTITATWDDVPLFDDPEYREAKLSQIPEHERDMRTRGIPTAGEGVVFPVPREQLEIEPIEIPLHWPRINGIDFGFNHPFAAAFVAWDRDNDTVYIYDGYKEKRTLPAVHADAIKRRGEWIPISWPKDGLQTEKGTGKELHEVYRRQGLNMFHTFFTNPPKMGDEEGKGGVSVEAGILEMLEMMETGRFKVFSTVKDFWEELGMYHRNGGKIVPLFDDFMSAVRYAVMFRRHAQTKTVFQPKVQARRGLRNW